jgi:hypothetical protein
LEHAGAGEGLEDLGQELWRDVVGLGDILRALGTAGGLLGEVLERHETVVGFFGEAKHA